jgi:Tol biopolymer transport system component
MIRASWALVVVAAADLLALFPRSLTGQTDAVVSRSGSASSRALSEERVVRFQVSEGTWTSLDVSPDGRTIVFDLLGDLYTLPITGGRARSLTAGPAFDAQPRFSPDGRRVAFVSDRSGISNIWLVDRDGRYARQLSHLRNESDSPVCSPTWSPDGRTIVASQRIGAAGQMKLSVDLLGHQARWLLAAYGVESGQMHWVSDTAVSRARRALGPVFSPDGTILYAAVEPYRSAYSVQTAWHIERVNPATGATAPEMAPALGRAGMRPAVSRDGHLLAYASVSGSRLGLRLRDLRTYKERWLVPEKLNPPSFWDGGGGDTRDLVPGYAFTPDSKALIVAFGGKIQRVEVATGRTRVIPFVVDVERELAPLTVHQFSLPDTAIRTRSVMQPALSPDGKAVAFSALSRIWIMDLPRGRLPAGRPRRLTSDSGGEFYPSWSPDGQWVAYTSWQDGQGGTVRRAWVRPIDKGVPAPSERLTTDTAIYFNTAVAPDGTHVVAMRAAMAPERLLTHHSAESTPSVSMVWIPVAGGATTVGTPATARVSGPLTGAEWATSRSPVEQLYFTTESNRVHVGLTSYESGSADQRTDFVVADSEIDIKAVNDITGVISPGGRRALLTHNWSLSELMLPARRGDRIDTVNVEQVQGRPFTAESGAAVRWGRALAPWISWSRDGRRVLFVQGGTLFVGDVPTDGWTAFMRVDVPLMVPVDIPLGTLVLRGARLITMRGREIIARGDLVVRNNRIVAVGSIGAVGIPSGAQVLDVAGKTILPGYVDIHDHLQYAYGVHPGQCWACLVRLAHGVTALRDPYAPQTLYNDVFAYRERERTGELLGPRIFSTGIVHLRSDRPIRRFEDALANVHPTAEYFDAETFKEYSTAPWPERRLIAAAAADVGLNATIHGDPLRAIIDGFAGVEHAIPVPLYDDVLTLIARSGATYTQTYGTIAGADGYVFSSGREPWEYQRMRRFVPPSVRLSTSALWLEEVSLFGHPEWDYLYPLLQTGAGIAARGGRVGMGMHGNIPGMGIHYEMWFHALGSMPNHEILRSATIVGATAIGHANDFGSLEPGKLADLQVLDENPITDIHSTTSIRYVMKNGRLYQADDLKEIWPSQRPLASIYLMDDSASGGPTTATEPAAPRQR